MAIGVGSGSGENLAVEGCEFAGEPANQHHSDVFCEAPFLADSSGFAPQQEEQYKYLFKEKKGS